jgi:pimeloyl-ACP methyl ester carboxylesterase
MPFVNCKGSFRFLTVMDEFITINKNRHYSNTPSLHAILNVVKLIFSDQIRRIRFSTGVNMAQVRSNRINLEYETFGSSTFPAVLLISRLGGQLLDWDESLCESIADRGYFVIRFDNRDSGLSSKIIDPEPGAAANMFKALMKGESVTPLYTIEDMAEDAVGLLGALRVTRVHICGISMGGIIAQTLAIRHPERVQSLISIYSTTGNPDLPPPKAEAVKVLFEPAPASRAAYIDYMVDLFRVISGSGIPFDEESHRLLAGRYFDRSFSPQGTAHQLIATMMQQNRKLQLAALTMPVLVIHGDDDPLMPLAAGRETAAAIPNADLVIMPGMGHDLPMMNNSHWVKILEKMVGHMQKAMS